ncbi:MAG: ABC transporter permease [Syntrophorhabdaceae bacterium]|nr:ABC transporter permease [Syntrophorhabdaceae bacterium]
MNIYRQIQHHIDLIIVFTQKDLKLRYKNSFLGYFWSVAHPVVYALIFYVAFKLIVRVPIENYALFLVCGLFPWQWFANSVGASPMIFFGNAQIIKKINFPRNIIPLALVLHDMIHFILAIPVIIAFVLYSGHKPYFFWFIGIPVLVIGQFCIIYGICLIISTLNIFFRDLERLTIIFINILFYATPVFYSEKMIPERYMFILKLNPMALFLINWRNLFLEGTLRLDYTMLSFFYGILFLGVGVLIYRKLSWRFAEVL